MFRVAAPGPRTYIRDASDDFGGLPYGGDLGSTRVMKQELHAERFADSLIR